MPFTARPSGGPSDEDLHELHATDSDAKWEYYIRMSFLKPAYNVVQGFGAMPQSFDGVLSGSVANDEKGRAIIEYIKSIGDPKNNPYNPEITPAKNPDLFDADHPKLFDSDHIPVHPESLAGIAARKVALRRLSAAPAGHRARPHRTWLIDKDVPP